MTTQEQVQTNEQETSKAQPPLHVAPGPHYGTTGRSTQSMMVDIIIGLLPAVGMALYVFGRQAIYVIGWSVGACMVTELIFQLIRRKPITLDDCSALVTGLILGLSIPWTSAGWIAVIGGVVAIALGKMVFGGLGNNIFNPAMVGRAFLMICFTTQLTTYTNTVMVPSRPGKNAPLVPMTQPPSTIKTDVLRYEGDDGQGQWVKAITTATPLSAAKYENLRTPLKRLAIGTVNGSVGETSALLLLLGGLYVCIRRTAAWQIPAGVLLGSLGVALVQYLVSPNTPLTPLHHLAGGGLMLGAFFIATDPVSSPVTVKGRWVFGLGVGGLVMVIRLFSSYPEGTMFAVLLMNCLTPMINRWTIPVPLGGKPAPAAA